jgi:DNA-binding NarL/FixJ family response regulator
VELLEVIKTETPPDLLLMDLGLPGIDGVEGIWRLKDLAPDLAVLVLTVSGDKEKVLDALHAGAAGYLLKSASVDEILDGIQQVFVGQAALSPSVAKIALSELDRSSTKQDFGLNAREIEVLELLAEGLAVKEIGAKLGITYAGAKFHLAKIYTKLSVQSQSGAVAKALRSGLI